jgi:hypothetical protein
LSSQIKALEAEHATLVKTSKATEQQLTTERDNLKTKLARITDEGQTASRSWQQQESILQVSLTPHPSPPPLDPHPPPFISPHAKPSSVTAQPEALNSALSPREPRPHRPELMMEMVID